MKRYLIPLLLLALVATSAVAQSQRPPKGHKAEPDVAQIVSNLSSSQKRQLDAIREESQARVEALRGQQKAVRDSIMLFMDKEGDQSRVLYPLFDREGQLQSAISREMYSTRLRIDEVLTSAQRTELKTACKQKRPKKEPRKK